MKFKQKIALIIFVFGTFLMARYLPHRILSTIPTVQATLPINTTYTPYISCSGVLQASDTQEVYALHPIMIEEVYVQPGDRVKKGEVLAKIDISTTQVLMNTKNQEEISDETLKQYRELAQQYGMEDELEEYLEQTSVLKGQSYYPTSEKLVSQHNGTIMSVFLTSGCMSEAGKQLYSINKSSGCSVVLQVEEQDIPLIKEGSQVIFYVSGQEGEPHQATVTKISPVVTRENQLLETNCYVEVWAEPVENCEILRPGSSVQAKIATGGTQRLSAVPYSAISQDKNNREFIYQLEKGKPVLRYIEIAKEESKHAYISSGLNGQQPVLLEAERFDPNSRYKIEYQGDNDV